jgi:hypothetical protein
MTVKLGGEAITPLLKCMANPLYRAIETDVSGPEESCKELAQVRVSCVLCLVCASMSSFMPSFWILHTPPTSLLETHTHTRNVYWIHDTGACRASAKDCGHGGVSRGLQDST